MARRGEKKYDDATREAALLIARKESAAEASRQLGISVHTIRAWRRAEGEAGPPSGADPTTWAEKKEEGARETWEKARSALDLVQTRLNEGDERKAKDAALTMAILIDKSAVLEKSSALEEERLGRLAESQGKAIAGALNEILSDLGLPVTAAVKGVFAHRLRALEGVKPQDGPPPTAEAARADIRRDFRAEWERERPTPPVASVLQLPAGGVDDEAEVVKGEIVEGLEDSGDPICPACGEAIPEDTLRAHRAGLDVTRLDCPAQDIEAIRRATSAQAAPGTDLQRTHW